MHTYIFMYIRVRVEGRVNLYLHRVWEFIKVWVNLKGVA